MATLQELAKEALSYYKQRIIQRDGKEVWIWTHTGDAPEWVRKMTREAHRGMLPDDWKFRFVVEALEVIYNSFEGREERDLEKWAAPAYNHQLLEWVSSHATRIEYVNEAVEAYGWPYEGLTVALMAGMEAEFRDVAMTVLTSLKDRQEDMEKEEVIT